MCHDGLNAPDLLAALSGRGHELRPASHPVQRFMGRYQGIQRSADGWLAASEPRFDGCVLGY